MYIDEYEMTLNCCSRANFRTLTANVDAQPISLQQRIRFQPAVHSLLFAQSTLRLCMIREFHEGLTSATPPRVTHHLDVHAGEIKADSSYQLFIYKLVN